MPPAIASEPSKDGRLETTRSLKAKRAKHPKPPNNDKTQAKLPEPKAEIKCLTGKKLENHPPALPTRDRPAQGHPPIRLSAPPPAGYAQGWPFAGQGRDWVASDQHLLAHSAVSSCSYRSL